MYKTSESLTDLPKILQGLQMPLLLNNKQLLDEVFVISGIIEVEVSAISRAKGRG